MAGPLRSPLRSCLLRGRSVRPLELLVGGAVVTVPGAPTAASVAEGVAAQSAVVSFTAPASNGGGTITGYTVTSSPGGITASGAGSPITITGLTNGQAYTFTVTATNSAGTGAASSPTGSFTPVLRNLLTKTEQFDDATWVKGSLTVTANTTAAPDGNTTADTLVAASTGTFRLATQAIATGTGIARSHSLYVKRSNNDWIYFSPFNDANCTWFNTSTGLFGTTAAGTTPTVSTVNGYFRIALGVTTTAATQASVGIADADGSFSATAAQSVIVWGAQLDAASSPSTYQRIP